MNTGPNRKSAKSGIVTREENDPELELAMAEAHKAQIELAKTHNDHKLAMHKLDLGKLGEFFGDGRNTTTFIALLTIITCLIIMVLAVICHAEDLKTILAVFSNIITLSLGYLFGKRTK